MEHIDTVMSRLTAEQKTFYKENGYIVLKDVLSEEELSAISAEYDKLFERKNQDKMESSWVGSDADDRRNDAAQTVSNSSTYRVSEPRNESSSSSAHSCPLLKIGLP